MEYNWLEKGKVLLTYSAINHKQLIRSSKYKMLIKIFACNVSDERFCNCRDYSRVAHRSSIIK
jgi:hypothetical protein